MKSGHALWTRPAAHLGYDGFIIGLDIVPSILLHWLTSRSLRKCMHIVILSGTSSIYKRKPSYLLYLLFKNVLTGVGAWVVRSVERLNSRLLTSV